MKKQKISYTSSKDLTLSPLTHSGKVSHQQAIDKAHEEYEKYRALTADEPSPVERDFIEVLKTVNQLEIHNKK